jgi:hypothetical protein
LLAAYLCCPAAAWLGVVCTFFAAFAGGFFGLEEGRYSFGDSLYFAVIAASTIGYHASALLHTHIQKCLAWRFQAPPSPVPDI